MSYARTIVLIALVLGLMDGSCFAQQLDEGSINEIREICDTVQKAAGAETAIQVQAEVQGKVSRLLSQLISVNGGASASINKKTFEGLTQDATASAMAGDRECRERLYNKILDARDKYRPKTQTNELHTSTPNRVVTEASPPTHAIMNLENVVVDGVRLGSDQKTLSSAGVKVISVGQGHLRFAKLPWSANFFVGEDFGSIRGNLEAKISMAGSLSAFRISFDSVKKRCQDMDLYRRLREQALAAWNIPGNNWVETYQDLENGDMKTKITIRSGDVDGSLFAYNAYGEQCIINISYAIN